MNYFRNSKNIKDIILLEKYKQNEYQKLENIKNLKKQYLKDINKEKKDYRQFKNENNPKIIKNKPLCFNDDINKNNKYQKYKLFSIKKNSTSYYINENLSFNEEKKNDTWNQNNNDNITNIINKLNYNYEIYKNILHNN